MTTLAEKIAIMHAGLNGKKIECRAYSYSNSTWEEVKDVEFCHWDWSQKDYRIKNQPREFWIVPLKVVTVRGIYTHVAGESLESVDGFDGVIHVREVVTP